MYSLTRPQNHIMTLHLCMFEDKDRLIKQNLQIMKRQYGGII